MIALSRQSKLVRFAYWMDKDGIPYQTNICSFVGAVVSSVLAVIQIAVLIFGLGWCLFYLLKWQFHWLMILYGTILAGLLFASFLAIAAENLDHRYKESTLRQYVQARKKRWCPMVTIEE